MMRDTKCENLCRHWTLYAEQDFGILAWRLQNIKNYAFIPLVLDHAESRAAFLVLQDRFMRTDPTGWRCQINFKKNQSLSHSLCKNTHWLSKL